MKTAALVFLCCISAFGLNLLIHQILDAIKSYKKMKHGIYLTSPDRLRRELIGFGVFIIAIAAITYIGVIAIITYM